MRDVVTGRAVLDRAPVHVHDLPAAGDEFATGRTMAEQLGFHTILAIPLLREGEAIGALMIRRTEMRPFTDKQIELLRTFADQAVIAIENVRLFEEIRARNREVTEALAQQTATSEILRVISTSRTDVQPVFETIVRRAVVLCGGLFANVFRFDGNLLHFVASHNIVPGHVELLRAKYPMRPDSPRCPVGSCSASRSSGLRMRLPILTTTSASLRSWAGVGCSASRCCVTAIRSASSSSAGRSLGRSRPSRKNC